MFVTQLLRGCAGILSFLASSLQFVATNRGRSSRQGRVFGKRCGSVIKLAVFTAVVVCALSAQDWRSWGGDPGGQRYSVLSQINRDNVRHLQPAWIFHTGEAAEIGARMNYATGRIEPFETTPLVVDDVMYLSSPSGRVFALDPESGRTIWKFDPQQTRARLPHTAVTRRLIRAAFVVFLLLLFFLWRAVRRFLSSAFLSSKSLTTGTNKSLPGVLNVSPVLVLAGVLFLVLQLLPPRQLPRTYHASRGVSYWQSSDGKDRRILFGTFEAGLKSRLIALDARTGRMRQDFGQKGSIDLRAGVADRWPNSIYAVTSPPAIYRDLAILGAEIPESPSHGPSGQVRAFDVRTGKLAWTFSPILINCQGSMNQWDRASAVDRTGANVWSIMSVDVQRGIVFLPVGSASYDYYGADRPGMNLYANSLVALEASTGKVIWHYQVVHHDIWDYDLPAQPILATIHREGREIPVVVQVTKMGFVFILDRLTGKPLFPVEERPVPRSDIPGEVSWPTQPYPLRPPALSIHSLQADQIRTESKACRDLLGPGTIGGLYAPHRLENTLQIPGPFGGGNWSGGSVDVAIDRLFVNTNNLLGIGRMREQPPGSAERFTLIAGHMENAFFWDENQTPCQRPPWGMLNAVDLQTGTIAWRTPLDTINVGGSIATAGGLVFLGATVDDRFRAFDSTTGQELWSAPLEAAAHATPMTYQGKYSGRQFVVIAAGGGGPFRGKVSDEVAAFSLSR